MVFSTVSKFVKEYLSPIEQPPGQNRISKNDLDGISPDGLRAIFSEQHETYRNCRSEAQKLISTLLAGATILVAVFRTEIIQLGSSLSIPNPEVTSPSGAIAFSPEFYVQAATNTLFVGTLLLIFAIGLVFQSATEAISVLQSDGLQPTSVSFSAGYTDPDQPEISTLQTWIEENDQKVSMAMCQMESAYTSLRYGIGFVAAAGIVGASVFLQSFELIAFVNGLVIVVPILVALGYLFRGIVAFEKEYQYHSLRDSVGAGLNKIGQSLERKSIPSHMKVLFIMLYGSLWEYSTTIVFIWADIFWIL